ncbi:DNA-processing protein DprA [Candidatus Sumerlaeota bacterium]|nr:DNA-processing protein DprA [Candidatus Sumerlaeota bacterium]
MSLDSWILFNAHPERDRRLLNALLKRFGAPEGILGATVHQLSHVPGVSEKFAQNLLLQEKQFPLPLEKETIEKDGIRLIPITHPEYPLNLKNMASPPPLLYTKGTLIPEDRYSVGVVGSRQNTSYGRRICEEIVGDLAKKGITIVSGMARGIDSLAHHFAIKNAGRTLAVLGNGLSLCYPPENKELLEQIISHGAAISEYPMTTYPVKKNFPERNEIIAGLSLGVLVVEANQKSGSLITARAALEENRSVYAVPGNIFKNAYRGTNDLIRQGAQMVRSADDIMEDLSLSMYGMLQEE